MPTSCYDTADGRRNFVFERRDVVTRPGYSDLRYGIHIPAVTGTAHCTTTVVARRVSDITSPDAFAVESLTGIGMC